MKNIYRDKRLIGEVIEQNTKNGIEYLTFPMLSDLGFVEHLFTTRLGGVSEGIFSSMNLSFTRGDDEAAVLENYRRIAKLFNKECKDIVASHQTHTTNIRCVTKDDMGKGVIKNRDYSDIDGLITNEKGVILATFFADCVPLYFVDAKNKAIGLAHSGWRGTVNFMGKAIVEAMKEEFGTRAEDIYAAIGPSICQECYEVSEDVAMEFKNKFSGYDEYMNEIIESKIMAKQNGDTMPLIMAGKAEGKYQLNLWLANLLVLRSSGVAFEHISVTDICTAHNSDYLFSHRASDGKRGNLGAFLMLKE